MRLLICHVCKTKEPLRDYHGRPDDDGELALLISRHKSAGVPHNGTLVHIEDKEWDNDEHRAEIIQKIDEGLTNAGQGEGLGAETYTMVDTFKDDAMTCFAQHRRNPACPDYRSDSKRLIPDTAVERKELGLAPASRYDTEGGQKTIYLCDYCPVHSMVVQAKRAQAGMYK